MLKVFTDGGCKGNGKKNARASYALVFAQPVKIGAEKSAIEAYGELRPSNYFLGKGRVISHGGEEVAPTNIRGEMFAIILALYLTTGPLEIVTDSEFSINVCSRWIKGWQKVGFQGKKNKDLLEILFVLMIDREIIFTHVNSHTRGLSPNEVGNDRADKLVSKILTEQEPNIFKINYTYV